MSELEVLKFKVTENNKLLMEICDKLESFIHSINNDVVFTSQEAANFLSVSRFVLKRMRENGEIPFHMNGSHYRFKRIDLETYINKIGA